MQMNRHEVARAANLITSHPEWYRLIITTGISSEEDIVRIARLIPSCPKVTLGWKSVTKIHDYIMGEELV